MNFDRYYALCISKCIASHRELPEDLRSYKGRATTSLGDHQPTPASEAGCDVAGSSWKQLACRHDEDNVDEDVTQTAGHHIHSSLSNMWRYHLKNIDYWKWKTATTIQLFGEQRPRACIKFGIAGGQRAWMGQGILSNSWRWSTHIDPGHRHGQNGWTCLWREDKTGCYPPHSMTAHWLQLVSWGTKGLDGPGKPQ